MNEIMPIVLPQIDDILSRHERSTGIEGSNGF